MRVIYYSQTPFAEAPTDRPTLYTTTEAPPTTLSPTDSQTNVPTLFDPRYHQTNTDRQPDDVLDQVSPYQPTFRCRLTHVLTPINPRCLRNPDAVRDRGSPNDNLKNVPTTFDQRCL